MKSKKTLKRALLSSVLALVLCFTMLIGTTYAWFTDSVTSSGNIIKSGTLNIDLLVKGGDTGFTEYTSVKATSAPIFNYQLWEPGYTSWANAKVTTTGNLALKYTMKIEAAGTVEGGLADVIDVYYAPSEVAKPGTRDLTGLTKLGTLADALAGTIVINDTLIPGTNDSDFATLALHMQESAGNEYQNKSIGTSFSLIILATQLTYEEDSFDDQYDADAVYPIVSQTSMNEAISDTSVTNVNLGAGTFEISQSQVLTEGKSIVGEGPDKTTLKIKATNGDGIKITNEDVSISDVKVDGTEVTSGGYKSLINVEKDGVVISSCEFVGGGQSTWNSTILVESIPTGGKFTVKDSKITGSFRGILRESCGADIIVDNCDIDAVYPINVDGGSTPSYVTVTNSKLHGWTSYSSITKATFENTEFSKGNSGYDVVAAYNDTDFINCTFDSSFDVYAQTNPFTFTFTNCVKNGTPVTAENFKTLFGDADVWNKCTCIVNGVQVPADT